MRYEFIKGHANQFSVDLICKILKVSRSGYYDWLTRTPSKRALANLQIDIKIKSIFNEHKQRYGSPRITKALQAQNELCSHTRVARRMKSMGLSAVAKKKFKVTTDSVHQHPIFEHLLNRDFSTTAINQKWASDITYVRTDEG
ncbi:MAG: IS3 family transposase [Gammaproteobacteria bacterium]|nr:IS3 family transposase [Gammaproteobacteria bacterium]